MDADFPGGNYTFTVNDGADSGLLTEPATEIFTTTIPYFTGNTWSHLQSVNAACPLKLYWNNFIPDPDSTSAYIFVRILDQYYNYAYTTNFLASDLTEVCIPADSLNAGSVYTIQLLFSDREDDVNYGFDSDAPATAGFDVLTYTLLITDGPVLCITPGVGSATLSWSISASNYELQYTYQLSPPSWHPLNSPVTVVGDQNQVVVQTSSQAEYFRLHVPQVFAVASSK
jgi:hypothetical protein